MQPWPWMPGAGAPFAPPPSARHCSNDGNRTKSNPKSLKQLIMSKLQRLVIAMSQIQ